MPKALQRWRKSRCWDLLQFGIILLIVQEAAFKTDEAATAFTLIMV